MKTLGILIKKELTESFKGKKLLALTILCVFFALLSPLTAKFMPVIFEQIMKGQDTGGLNISMGAAPTYVDAYGQFFKNFTQMGILIIMIIFMGMVSGEKTKGTAVLVLTKCVPRHAFILSKYIASVIVFTAAYLLSIGVYLYYTFLLFNKAIDSSTLPAFLFFGLFVLFMLSLTLFASTVAKSTGMSAAIVLISFFALSIVNSLPAIKQYSPMTLSAFPYPFPDSNIYGAYSANIITAVILTILLVGASVAVFRKQEI